MTLAPRPRLAPERPFPPYSYVTGHFPHPFRDPRGHSFGQHPEPVAALQADRWASSPDYLAAIDLFNHGYYWEAHEAWESLWHAAGRSGLLADFLKGLIKLAAAGVKAREGRPVGIKRHAQRAGELFAATRDRGNESHRCLGLDLDELISVANGLAHAPPVVRRRSLSGQTAAAEVPPVEIVFDFLLVPWDAAEPPFDSPS